MAGDTLKAEVDEEEEWVYQASYSKLNVLEDKSHVAIMCKRVGSEKEYMRKVVGSGDVVKYANGDMLNKARGLCM
jgi:catabolite regulation protein CreA